MLPDINTIEADFLKFILAHTGQPTENGREISSSLEDRNSIIFYEHDLSTHKSAFVSNNFETITGYPCEKLREEANFMFKIIPPKELARLVDMGKKALDYIMELPMNERQGSSMRFYFPIIKSNGSILWLMDLFMITELNSEGRIYKSGGYMIDITNTKPSCIRAMVETVSGNIFLINTESTVFFSKREIELLKLINEGLSSKEIATKLSISVNTVNNHRSNMMHRNEVRNMIEVLRIAREHKVI